MLALAQEMDWKQTSADAFSWTNPDKLSIYVVVFHVNELKYYYIIGLLSY